MLAIPPSGMFRLVCDFESFYDSDVSLSRMSVLNYLFHPRFEIIGCSLRVDTHDLGEGSGAYLRPFTPAARWYEQGDLRAVFASVPWERCALVSHNIGFDGAILAWHYGHVPAFYLDTLGMSRALVLPYTGGASLAKVAAHFELPPKQSDVIVNARGWTLEMFRNSPAYYQAYKAYCEHDSDLCSGILDRIAINTPQDEILLADMVTRMTIQPQLVLDRGVLADHLEMVTTAKEKLLAKLRTGGIIADDGSSKPRDLMSDAKLADILHQLGVAVPTKISVRTGLNSYAFAKTDAAFTALQEDENPLVQAVVAARLGVKTTIEETRTERFIAVADAVWPAASEHAMLPSTKNLPMRMPFPLKFSGAHTHRLSGDWRLNLQNLGRKSPLRKAITAPPGYLIVAADASQIEARVVCWLAGAQKVLADFRSHTDPYLRLAEFVYRKRLTKEGNPTERFVGKTAVLGLGFGMGWTKFITTCWNQGRILIDEALAQRVVKAYRNDYAPEVTTLWRDMEYLGKCMALNEVTALGPISALGKRILLPNGMWLHYNNMRYEMRSSPWDSGETSEQLVFDFGKEVVTTFGGKLTENVVQALARIITMNAAIRIRKRWGVKFPLAIQIHDQLGYVVPERHAESFLTRVLLPEMRTAPDWCRDLPLDAEGAIGHNLADAK